MFKKIPSGGLILAGLAAFAYYKYSQMSEEQKSKIVSDLKEKGQKLYDQYAPEEIKNMFGKKEDTAAANPHFGEGGGYTS